MFKSFLTAALVATTGLIAAPAIAAPVAPLAPLADVGTDVTQVHYRGGRGHVHGRRAVRGPVYHPRRYRRYSRPRTSFGVQLNFGPAYVAPRYRQVPTYRAYGSRHHTWCSNRYRSYRVSDGTFQPYHGGRRRCNSPYDGI